MMKKLISLLLVFALLFLLQSCKDKHQPVPDQPTITQKEDYVGESTTAAGQTGTNSSWKANYRLKYNYIYMGETSSIIEMKSGDYFAIVDEGTGLTAYYTQGEGSTIEYYMLNTAGKTGNRLKQENALMADLNSPFMNLSFVSPDFTSFANVVFEGDDIVAGRPAKRYKQTQTDATGQMTDYLYAWIDTELNFAVKCTICKADGT
ncbi:MAG: hypothetical protein LBS36_02490, partial [Oscillospiraceae bacterium]|nr:hypothetical protein [Oscillospiraceae bacterium]